MGRRKAINKSTYPMTSAPKRTVHDGVGLEKDLPLYRVLQRTHTAMHYTRYQAGVSALAG